ncbi:MAG TPA: flagellar biosynthetic protein FliP, partial [Campylobacteraceae bacterium]|nr:flagellar biosynthetic protein FliP [Campylobacteraceae bacterium]
MLFVAISFAFGADPVQVPTVNISLSAPSEPKDLVSS